VEKNGKKKEMEKELEREGKVAKKREESERDRGKEREGGSSKKQKEKERERERMILFSRNDKNWLFGHANLFLGSLRGKKNLNTSIVYLWQKG